jgi:sterol 3beta-glucosyltransferase
MRITILAIGSRGDVQPYVALGVELKKAGAFVRIVTFENFGDFVTDHGLEFYPISGDVSKIASSDAVRSAMQADNPLKVLLSFNTLKTLAAQLQKDFFEACQGSDVIVYHPGPSIGYFIAQHLNVPSVLASPFPMTPTREYPSLIFYDMPHLGRSFNYLTHKIFEQIMWMASSGPIKQFWKEKFGHAPKDFASPFGRQTTLSHPTIVSCSEYVFPTPKDWPAHVHNTGYWFLDDDKVWTPPVDLLNFLNHGAPSVYVGFGSIGDRKAAEHTTRTVINALKISGQRGVLATGWNGMAKVDNLPEDVFILESAPHSWLFPRMAAVVHHGGAGTTAAGLRAGVPGVIVPFSNDQFAWGRRVYELGVGAKPIPRKKLTSANLAGAIQFILSDGVKDAAKELGRKIQSENGAERAARVVVECMKLG